MSTTTITITQASQLASLAAGIPLNPLPGAPPSDRDPTVPHAPKRVPNLSTEDKKLAIRNALRYFPAELHKTLAPEFLEELEKYGHIYMYRFRPTNYEMKAHPIDQYPAKTMQAKCIQMMIMNNLDPAVAQFPHELITYGGNGAVFQNWAQYHLVMKYLSEMTENQTLAMYSGHPMGLFPSHPDAPRVVITNGMVIPQFSDKEHYEKLSATGNTMYGQMTAGSYCYIGPQGIVHGTTLTVLNAGRKYLNQNDLAGKVLVTSGLGGMSGAQPKAAKICGCISVTAEIDEKAAKKRHAQGWVDVISSSLDDVIRMIKQARSSKAVMSIAYLGNIVDLWERLAQESELLVELGSDQTSLHNPFNGGYYPVGVSFEESNRMMYADPGKFKDLVQVSLRRHVEAINKLVARGMRFWDYGNSFLLEAGRAGADIFRDEAKSKFKYPSYVEDIMGDIFSLGFGPFRWVCSSGDPADLELTDKVAGDICEKLSAEADEWSKMQYEDNLKWIRQAGPHKLVVGSQARILYSDQIGRMAIAQAFNELVRDGKLKGPVVISRDHHDVSGTDSPYRETSNVSDGSNTTADMAVQNFVGCTFRGATWASLHNGGGTGWGMAMNGGFGMVLDGSAEASRRASDMLFWDVLNGVSRRAWGRNANAEHVIAKAQEVNPNLKVTMPNHCDDNLLDGLFK